MKGIITSVLLITFLLTLVITVCEYPLTFLAGYFIATFISIVVLPIWIVTQMSGGLEQDYYIIEEGVEQYEHTVN